MITTNIKFLSTQKLLKEFKKGKGVSVQEGLMEKIKFAHALCEAFDKKDEN